MRADPLSRWRDAGPTLVACRVSRWRDAGPTLVACRVGGCGPAQVG